jgi:hypothetical protein
MELEKNNAKQTNDSENIMALASNLYSHKLFEQSPAATDISERLMDQRSLYAMRNMTENSFASMVSKRTSGTGGDANAIKALVYELGGTPDTILGTRPSYETTMSALSRKLFQAPAFYANLMEGKTNVARQQVALEAIDLMNKRDIYQSLERTEMLTALWLEVKLKQQQKQITNKGVALK